MPVLEIMSAEGSEFLVDGRNIYSLRVVDLKYELEKRGMSKSGSKKELTERLKRQLTLDQVQQASSANLDEDAAPNFSLKEDDKVGQSDLIRQYLARQQQAFHEQKSAKSKLEESGRMSSDSEAKSASDSEAMPPPDRTSPDTDKLAFSETKPNDIIDVAGKDQDVGLRDVKHTNGSGDSADTISSAIGSSVDHGKTKMDVTNEEEMDAGEQGTKFEEKLTIPEEKPNSPVVESAADTGRRKLRRHSLQRLRKDAESPHRDGVRRHDGGLAESNGSHSTSSEVSPADNQAKETVAGATADALRERHVETTEEQLVEERDAFQKVIPGEATEDEKNYQSLAGAGRSRSEVLLPAAQVEIVTDVSKPVEVISSIADESAAEEKDRSMGEICIPVDQIPIPADLTKTRSPQGKVSSEEEDKTAVVHIPETSKSERAHPVSDEDESPAKIPRLEKSKEEADDISRMSAEEEEKVRTSHSRSSSKSRSRSRSRSSSSSASSHRSRSASQSGSSSRSSSQSSRSPSPSGKSSNTAALSPFKMKSLSRSPPRCRSLLRSGAKVKEHSHAHKPTTHEEEFTEEVPKRGENDDSSRDVSHSPDHRNETHRHDHKEHSPGRGEDSKKHDYRKDSLTSDYRKESRKEDFHRRDDDGEVSPRRGGAGDSLDVDHGDDSSKDETVAGKPVESSLKVVSQEKESFVESQGEAVERGEKSIDLEVEANETVESLKKKQSDVVAMPISTRKISISSKRSSAQEQKGETENQPAQRKRRWGSSKRFGKKTSVAISSEILKDIVPDVKMASLHDEAINLNISGDETKMSDAENENETAEPKKDNEMETTEPSRKIFLRKGAADKDDERKVEERDAAGNEVVEIVEDDDVENKKPADSEARKSPEVEHENKVTDSSAPRPLLLGDEPEAPRRPPSPARNPVTRFIHIRNLVRPFTLNQLKELLRRTGNIKEETFWIDKIKSHCYVEYESAKEAEATRKSLHGVTWPSSNPKVLRVEYGTEDEVEFHRELSKKNELEAEAFKDKLRLQRKEEKRRKKLVEAKVAEKEKDKKQRPTEQQPSRKKASSPIEIREWDLDKIPGRSPPEYSRNRPKSRSPVDKRREREARERRHSRQDSRERRMRERSRERRDKKEKKKEEAPAKLLDDLFRKTKTTPCIYWLPLTEEQFAQKEKERAQRMEERERRRRLIAKKEKEEAEAMQKEREEKHQERSKEKERSRSRSHRRRH